MSTLNNTQNAIISIDAAKDKLMLNYKHECGNDVASQIKLDKYTLVKREFGAEEYVNFVMSKKNYDPFWFSYEQDAFLLKSSSDATYNFQEMNDCVNNALRELLKMRNISYSTVTDTETLDMILQEK